MNKVSIVSLVILGLAAQQASCEIYLLGNNFGYGIYPSNFLGFQYEPVVNFHHLRLRPFDFIGKQLENDNNVHFAKDGFEVSLNMNDFKLEEITVKTIDNSIVIEAKHEDHGDSQDVVTKQMIRTYTLPNGYDPSKVVSTLSSDGVLTVKAPAPAESEIKSVERLVEIQHIESSSVGAHGDVPDNADSVHKLIKKLSKDGN